MRRDSPRFAGHDASDSDETIEEGLEDFEDVDDEFETIECGLTAMLFVTAMEARDLEWATRSYKTSGDKLEGLECGTTDLSTMELPLDGVRSMCGLFPIPIEDISTLR